MPEQAGIANGQEVIVNVEIAKQPILNIKGLAYVLNAGKRQSAIKQLKEINGKKNIGKTIWKK